MREDFHIVAAGDAALILEFEARIDVAINARALAVADALKSSPPIGVRDIVPTFRSVAIYFDPLLAAPDHVIDRLRSLATATGSRPVATSAPIRVPVWYGGEFGPDLAEVARFADMSPPEVVERHAGTTYRVFMLGFAPGFAYLASVDPRIAVPRRTTPRTRVPAGSVAIAGSQTGIYPTETPGGWQIIGRTPVKPFDLTRPHASLFTPGDTVQFYAVEPA